MGLDKDCFAGIRDLTRMVGGISNVAVPSLIAMLQVLMCADKIFKCTLLTMLHVAPSSLIGTAHELAIDRRHYSVIV